MVGGIPGERVYDIAVPADSKSREDSRGKAAIRGHGSLAALFMLSMTKEEAAAIAMFI